MRLPTTPDYIAQHAQNRPQALAVIDQGKAVTWASFQQDLVRVCAALQALGAQAGTRVALICEDRYLHWLLVLACEQLGAVSDAILEPHSEPWATLPQRADLLLTNWKPPLEPPCAWQLLTPHWLAQLRLRGDLPHLAAPTLPANAPARVARSSGTTGATRRMLLTRQDLDRRVSNVMALLGVTSASRFLLTLQPAASTACFQANACARAGATVVLAPPASAWKVFARDGVTHLFCLPGILSQWLNTLPPGFQKPEALHIFCGGASVSPQLQQQALALLATQFDEVYASNEAGMAANGPSADAAALLLRAGCLSEIVDDNHQRRPWGETGHIRLRTPSMVSGYLDEAGPGTNFHDGWFYPGDVGCMPDPQHLRVQGRIADLMNLGGVKLLPEAIEARLLSTQVPAHELAVCSLPNALGVEEVWVALSGQAAAQQDRIVQALVPVCQEYWWVKFRVVQLDTVNPQAPGKLSRRALRETLARRQ